MLPFLNSREREFVLLLIRNEFSEVSSMVKVVFPWQEANAVEINKMTNL